MNSRLLSALCLAAAVSTAALTPLSAAAPNHHPCAYAVRTVYVDPASGADRIAHGTSKTAVLEMIGSPVRGLAPEVWVYRGFRADLDEANDEDCRMLVITFARGEVADLKLVNEPAVAILASTANPAQMQRYASAR